MLSNRPVFDVAAPGEGRVSDRRPDEGGAEEEEAGGESGLSDGGGRQTASSRSEYVTWLQETLLSDWLVAVSYYQIVQQIRGRNCLFYVIKILKRKFN